jgi:hypothetical protein
MKWYLVTEWREVGDDWMKKKLRKKVTEAGVESIEKTE